jgi:hypothetical protein
MLTELTAKERVLYWRKYIADLEYAVYGHQDKVFKILKDLNKESIKILYD